MYKLVSSLARAYADLKPAFDDVGYSKEQQDRSRLKFTGVMEHQVELNRRDRYPKFDEYVARFRAMQDEM